MFFLCLCICFAVTYLLKTLYSSGNEKSKLTLQERYFCANVGGRYVNNKHHYILSVKWLLLICNGLLSATLRLSS